MVLNLKLTISIVILLWCILFCLYVAERRDIDYNGFDSGYWGRRSDEDQQSPSDRRDYEDDSPGRRKSPRPRHLILSHQHSSTSASSEEDQEGNRRNTEEDRIELVSQSGGRPLIDRAPRDPRERDYERERRERAERELREMEARERRRAEVEREQRGPDPSEPPTKKKPSALDRMSLVEHEKAPERSQSPSRRSPRSPPRSPNWMRYRESPPRSPPVRSMSPKSPTERFPASFSDFSPPSSGREDLFIDPYGFRPENIPDEDHLFFSYEQRDIGSMVRAADGTMISNKPPPKPARMSDQYEFQDEDHPELLGPDVIDLASFAATVASDTAHLTNLSVSPTNMPVHHLQHDYLEISPEQDSMSPPSPNYYEEVDDIDVAEPTPKNIDYQGSKRQKVRPPASDWSPITDLSPIIDVSPSIEAAEQEEMQRLSKSEEKVDEDSATSEITGGDKDSLQSLKRYQKFEDISRIGDGESQTADGAKVYAAAAAACESRPGDSCSRDMIHAQPSAANRENPAVPDENRLRQLQAQQEREGQAGKAVAIQPHKQQQTQDVGRTATVEKAFVPTMESAHTERISESSRDIDELDAGNTDTVKRVRPPAEKAAVDTTVPSKEVMPAGQYSGHSQESSQHPREQVDASTNRGLASESCKDTKVKPHPLSIKQVEHEEDNLSPHYRVMISPISPGRQVDREYAELHELSPGSCEDEHLYMFPSPMTPPDQVVSPPKPQSPSFFHEQLDLSEVDIMVAMSTDYNSDEPCVTEVSSTPGVPELTVVSSTSPDVACNTTVMPSKPEMVTVLTNTMGDVTTKPVTTAMPATPATVKVCETS